MEAKNNLIMEGIDVIGLVYASREDGGKAERLARLFAASEDMLASLTELVRYRDSRSSSESERAGSDGRYTRARAAIAKAGEKP